MILASPTTPALLIFDNVYPCGLHRTTSSVIAVLLIPSVTIRILPLSVSTSKSVAHVLYNKFPCFCPLSHTRLSLIDLP